MTEYKYTYSISEDTADGKVAVDALLSEISESPITTALDLVNTSGDVLDIYFKAALSTEDEASLDAIVGNHEGNMSDSLLKVEATIAQTLETKLVEQVDPPPFAAPTYRTKFDKTGSIVEVEKNNSVSIDYQIGSELYVFGGEGVAKNAEFGDYITAEINDKDSVIPEGYRAAMCENWPTVASYANMWLMVSDSVANNPFTKIYINTYPLIAKISAGLYLRVTYHAIDTGSTREVALNYFLDKKI